MTSTVSRGNQVECLVAEYLTNHKIIIVGKNIRYPFGEIDLLGITNNTLIAFEVRYRKSIKIMGALETITNQKLLKIMRCLEAYTQSHSEYDAYNLQIDCIGVEGRIDTPTIKWIKNIYLP